MKTLIYMRFEMLFIIEFYHMFYSRNDDTIMLSWIQSYKYRYLLLYFKLMTRLSPVFNEEFSIY